MEEGAALELAACSHFLQHYNDRHQSKFEITEHRDKPDFLSIDPETHEEIGIEVMHLFYDRQEAKQLLGRSSKKLHGVMTIDVLIQKLNGDLVKKIEQAFKYDFSNKMFLLIRVASPIYGKQDFEIFFEDIECHPANPFDEIWLLFWNQTTQTYSDLLQIQ